MTTLRRFHCDDLLTFNNVNLDILTETYNLPFYLQYLAKWPEYCQVAEGPGKQTMGYILGALPLQRFFSLHCMQALRAPCICMTLICCKLFPIRKH